jgi:DNA-binding Lrp family transcriptional regulator
MSLKMENQAGKPTAARLHPGEAAVARRLQGDIPLVDRPFQQIGKDIGLTEADVLSIADRLRTRGIIRKFGAIVRHQMAGYTHNIMVLWAVPPGECDAAGRRLATFPEITHCYERVPPFEEKYTIFTMIHFHQERDEDLLRKMAAAAGVNDFKVLRSIEEFKKSSMEYF